MESAASVALALAAFTASAVGVFGGDTLVLGAPGFVGVCGFFFYKTLTQKKHSGSCSNAGSLVTREVGCIDLSGLPNLI
jgi:hypothetical protein